MDKSAKKKVIEFLRSHYNCEGDAEQLDNIHRDELVRVIEENEVINNDFQEYLGGITASLEKNQRQKLPEEFKKLINNIVLKDSVSEYYGNFYIGFYCNETILGCATKMMVLYFDKSKAVLVSGFEEANEVVESLSKHKNLLKTLRDAAMFSDEANARLFRQKRRLIYRGRVMVTDSEAIAINFKSIPSERRPEAVPDFATLLICTNDVGREVIGASAIGIFNSNLRAKAWTMLFVNYATLEGKPLRLNEIFDFVKKDNQITNFLKLDEEKRVFAKPAGIQKVWIEKLKESAH